MMKVHSISLSSYTKPEITEQRNKDWVEYGADNNYYQYLIDRYNGSPTNNAIINAISDLIYGKGLDATDSSRKPQEYAAMRSLIHSDCLRKVTADLKMMGQCAFQIIYTKDRQVAQVEHMPIQTLRAEKMNEEGEIEAYYYCADWTKLTPNKMPDRIPAFGKSNEGLEILVVRPYKAGYYYYSPVDYQGGLPYAELEEEIANYHLNNIKNGMAPSMLINFNNGVPDEEERMLIEQRITEKWSGSSNAGRAIIAFNESKELAATIDPVQLSDAAAQYEFLSGESMQKLMVAHRVTSPMLLGIKDNSGLGNNAEEIETATLLFDNTVIRPFQEQIVAALDQILAVNGINLDLYFKTLQPLEFTDRSAAVTKEEQEKETGEKLSADCGCRTELKDADDPCEPGYVMVGTKMKDGKKVPNCVPEDSVNASADELIDLGEEINEEEWELVDEREVDYDQEEALDKMIGLASTGTARPRAKSEQDAEKDGVLFLVRYQYDGSKSPEREFCRKMMSANKVYRKEDIVALDNRAVNAGFGPEGAATYSIWLYKGGPRCHHKWLRKTYMSRNGVKPDPSSPNAKTVSRSQARRAGFDPPTNPNKVSVEPNKMKNKGFLNPKSPKDIQPGI